ncbi:MAG: hypothetical protein KIT80_00715 [Chitinophagaceae bacterium]|nr:hypothetical protein [Chitinophagaceae bacterium]MCW5925412.1 hypothetical protein [Chitinophagaceae bacterium]
MSKGIDIQFVRETYQRMTDKELIRIATQDAAGLTPEAQEVVKEEIERRKLDTNIIKGVQAQNKSYTVEEIDEYCNLARNLSCPICETNSAMLNATRTSEVMSFILFTQYKRQLKVACPACLDKANNNALIKTIILGWWGIPWGFIRTIQAIGHNIKDKKTNHNNTPNDYLRSFVLSKIGQFETYRDNKEMLQQIISTE